MSEALQVKKIYVDSRYRTADSVSDSNFKIQLGRNKYIHRIIALCTLKTVLFPIHGIP